MDALILSCATGGGHNTAAYAMKEELESRGHHADFFDPYALSGKKLDKKVGNCYIKLVQKVPSAFGIVYKIGDMYRHLPGKSPVYWGNRKTARLMQSYLEKHHYDVIFTTHLFPGEILTRLKRRSVAIPKLIFIATDYTCIPFTEEIECDYFIIPSKRHRKEFGARGIPQEKLVPIGIPVRQSFRKELSRKKALERLGLNPDKHYILLSGGSMGAGKIHNAMDILADFLQEHPDYRTIVICGNNQKLYEKLQEAFAEHPQFILLKSTKHMAVYLKACDVYLSKPGGLSSTEAAVSNIPLIHMPPIPGCETRNQTYFSSLGMSISVSNLEEELVQALEHLQKEEAIEEMKQAQRREINSRAATEICEFAEKIIS